MFNIMALGASFAPRKLVEIGRLHDQSCSGGLEKKSKFSASFGRVRSEKLGDALQLLQTNEFMSASSTSFVETLYVRVVRAGRSM